MKKGVLVASCFWTVFLCLWGKAYPQYSPILAKNLLDELYNDNYSSLVRPSATVQVNTSLTVYTINSLDIIDQTLSVSGMLSMTWKDPRLAWSSLSDYSAVKFIFNTEENTWVPPIFVQNSVDDMEVISDENWTMRISPDGTITWNPSGVYLVSCECDVKYYPFDTQKCYIIFTTAGYSSMDIQFNADDDAVDVSNYVQNGEWKIVSLSAETFGSRSVSSGDATYSKIQFSFNLKRRHIFHIINTIFPVIVMVFLIPLVFKLDLGSSDKTDYALTVLLSYSVYLTMVADRIPSTSVSVCYMSLYLATMLAVSTISVPFGILVVHVFNKGDAPMHPTVQFLAGKILRKIACCRKLTCCCPERGGTINNKSDKNGGNGVNQSYSSEEDLRNPVESSSDDDLGYSITWQKTAILLDHVFFILFLFVVILITFIFFVILAINY